MRIENKNILADLSGTDLASSITGPALSLEHMGGYSFFVKLTGSPVGSLSLQASNDPAEPNGAAPSNWVTLASPAAVAISAAGTTFLNVPDVFYRWVRLVYTATSGTGAVSVCNVMMKGF